MNDKPNLTSESPVFETSQSVQESQKVSEKVSYERKIVSCVYETMTLQQITRDPSLTQRLTKICNISFDQGDTPYLDNFSPETIVSIAFDKQDRTAWGLAFAELNTYDVDPKYVSPQQYHVHSIAVHPEARNNGLCKGLTKALVKHCRKQYLKAPIYLNVRVTASNPNIGGIKDATADIARPTRIRNLLGADFAQLSGEDATALPYLAAGGHGCISVTANVAPKLLSDMHKAWTVGNIAEAQAINERLMPLHDAMFCEASPGPVKYAAELLGICNAETRLPLCEIAPASKACVEAALRGVGLMS